MGIDYLYDLLDYKIYHIDEISSTNTFFKENYDKYKDKSVLICDKQTNGYGRLDHKWISDNDLTFSILYNHKNNYLLVPLSVIYALKKYKIDSKIKWPNDIFIDNIKIGGILIEDIYLDKFISSIVGIGIDLSKKEEFNVLSFDKLFSLDKYDLLNNIIISYEELSKLDDKKILSLYKENSLVINKNFYYNDKLYKCIDIDDNGNIIAKYDDKIVNVSSGDIKIKWEL